MVLRDAYHPTIVLQSLIVFNASCLLDNAMQDIV